MNNEEAADVRRALGDINARLTAVLYAIETLQHKLCGDAKRTPLAELVGVPIRVRKRLMVMEIEYLEDLHGVTAAQFLQGKNVGQRTLAALRAVMDAHGVCFRGEIWSGRPQT